jgi:aminopeptidase N
MTKVKHLTQQFTPTTYNVSISIDPDALRFSGQVKINGSVSSKTKAISLHSKDLKIEQATVDDTKAITSEHDQDELKLTTKSEILPGEHEILIKFSGEISDTMHGVYQAPYIENGVERKIIATQLESHHAREVFPCVDEPMAKAKFNIELTYPKDSVALSNMPASCHAENNGLMTTTFDATPIMSTYLVAFAIGDYKSISKQTKHGVEVSAWATAANIGYCDFALDVAVEGLEFFEDYFGIKYPLPKCDLAVVPSFSAAAMENWGLITFRESAMYVDPKNTKLASKQRIAETIIHELAHQWFGNLVTMEWWTDLWLNEGFASWAANFGVDKLFPEWNYWAQFIASDFTTVQSADALPSSRPIEVEINDPEEIRSLFDEISYSKGPTIVRMLHQYLGDKDFRTGISHYLAKHSYNNATTADLWAALQEKSGKPVAKFMSAWTSQAGYPVIDVDITKDGLVLSQDRFLLTGKAAHSIWPVALTHQGTDEVFLLDKKTATWDTDVNGRPKFNVDQGGLYLVAYPQDYLEALKGKVVSQKLPAVDRLGLIDDCFLLAKAGKGAITDSLDLIFRLGHEENLVVWEAIAGQIASIRRVMDDEDIIENMRPFAQKLASHNLRRLGWEQIADEPSFDTMLRPLILSLAGFGDDSGVVDKSKAMFKRATKPEDIEPNVRNVVYGVAVRHGAQPEFDKLLKFYRETASPQEKQALAGAITGFKQPGIISQALELIKTEVKLQDAGFWLAYSFSNRYAKQQMWDWTKSNWDWIISKFKDDIMTLSWIPEYSAYAFSTQEFLDDYQAFWKINSLKSIERDINKGIEALTWQIKWRDQDLSSVRKYFAPSSK